MASAPSRPLRALTALLILVLLLIGLLALTKTWTPKLGLDLRGGTTITLKADNTSGGGAVDPTSLQQAKTIIESRVNSLGVGEAEVTTSGSDQIVVSVPNVQSDDLVALVGKTAVLRFRAVYAAEQSTPATSDPQASGEPADPSAAPPEPSVAPSASPTVNRRPMPGLPTAPPAPVTNCADEAPGVPADKAIDWQPSESCTSQFASFNCSGDQPQPEEVADQPLFACSEDGFQKYLLGPTLIQGDSLSSASAGVPAQGIEWQVNLQFNADGATAFENATRALSQRAEPMNRFAIVLDGESISAPSVNQAIAGGQAQITGGFNQKTATDLANVLKYGALPLSFTVNEVNNVSATLGGEQLSAGIVAGLIGLALVIVFCFLYYRGLGIVVVASLAIAGIITYSSMVLLGSSVGFALSLPGIAGAIVAIGVTADSFVIFFERIRDEVREGRSLRTAVETGWRRARQTILIVDAVSLLSALILFILALGSVKGFAFTLGLTTLIDVLVVFAFTKPLMVLLSRTHFFGGGHRLSGLDPEHLGVKALPGLRTRRPAAAAAGAALAEQTARIEKEG